MSSILLESLNLSTLTKQHEFLIPRIEEVKNSTKLTDLNFALKMDNATTASWCQHDWQNGRFINTKVFLVSIRASLQKKEVR